MKKQQFKIVRIGEPLPTYNCDIPQKAVDYWRANVEKQDWFSPDREHLIVLALNTRMNVTGWTLVSIGSLNESIAHPREIMRPCVVANAYGLLLMHNHPSGNPQPSQSDLDITLKIRDCTRLFQIQFVDHVIVGENYYSFKESGYI